LANERKYDALADQFNPQKYETRTYGWKRQRGRALNTCVFLTRHHDGYALWPSESAILGTKAEVARAGLVKPYVDACRKHGLKVGFYYSPHRLALQSARPGRYGASPGVTAKCTIRIFLRRDRETYEVGRYPAARNQKYLDPKFYV